ncbi:hypothetical protein [Pseudalkalibacillus caeni]|uniref:Uncharacterized protein n=1 Tax=Exobacillus caeni TaxID=2574798 RepID=A0A5R9F410_9BACL|nr:hypothetical protein [Pseudalkalibacillus caeni]TLS35204.1 hypothetical protein FCL54_21635 [Pseudalkalibacillus caeni]
MGDGWIKIQKTFYPNIKSIELTMLAVYIIVVAFGSALMWVNSDLTFSRWKTFMLVGLIYIGVCFVLSVSIRNQRIELTDQEFRLILLGFVRKEIKYNRIREIKIGKLNGSPVVEVTFADGSSTTKVPFIPFEKDWYSIARFIKQRNKRILIKL